MKDYVSALDLIKLSNEVGNALIHSEHAINELQLTNGKCDFDYIWEYILDIQFCDLDDRETQIVKTVCEHLIKASCEMLSGAKHIDEFINSNISYDEKKQLEFYFFDDYQDK